jgi:hypothetical protein
MNVRKTDVFLADVEKQYRWYVSNAGLEVADRYLDSVESNLPVNFPSTAVGAIRAI